MRAVRAFVISFLLSLLLFGVCGWGIMNVVPGMKFTTPKLENSTAELEEGKKGDYASPEDKAPTGANEADVTVENVEDIVLPEGDESEAVFLFIGTDYQPSVINYKNSGFDENGYYVKKREVSADAILLLKIDRNKKTFMFSAIPANTVMSSTSNKTLSQLYSEKGASYVVDCVYALTDIQVEHVAVISVEDCVKAFKKIGNVTYNVPCNMKAEEEWQNYKIDLKSGVQNFTPKLIVDMLRYKGYSNNTSYTREKLLMDFSKTLFQQLTSASYISKAPDLFKEVIGYFETNFDIEDFTDNMDLIFSYPDYNAVTVTFPGYEKSVYGKNVFVPDISAVADAYEEFK